MILQTEIQRQVVEAQTFLRELFIGSEETPVSGHLRILALPGAGVQSFPISQMDRAAEVAVIQARHYDVYFGIGLQRDPPSGQRRGDAHGVSVISGLWFDLDCATSYRDRSDLPASQEEALSFLDDLPIRPTMVIQTGGGLCPLWAFDRPFQITSVEERLWITACSKGWQQLLFQRGEARGWAFDETPDLARVLRIPGTLNHKSTPPRPVKLLSDFGSTTRPEVADFHPFAAKSPTPPKVLSPSLPRVKSGPDGAWNTPYMRRAVSGEIGELLQAPVGSRNTSLNKAAYSLARFVAEGFLKAIEVRELLTWAARSTGLQEPEIARTIDSAFRARLENTG